MNLQHIAGVLRTLLVVITGGILITGCVQENVVQDRGAAPDIFLMPSNVLAAGAYHGVNFFFEVDLRRDSQGFHSDDLPEVARWNEAELQRGKPTSRQLPPIVPEFFPGGREVYRLKDLHRVDYYNSMFEVGKYRYVRMPRGRLYIFKKRKGPFSFVFRGQKIQVPGDTPWTPSVYYFPEESRERRKRKLVREVVQVALTTIESFPEKGYWLINGKQYYPDTQKPLVLHGSLHAPGTR